MIVVCPSSEKDALNTCRHLQVVELCCEGGPPRRTSFGAALHSHRLDSTNLEAAGQLVGVVSIAHSACSHARPADSRGFTALFVHPRTHAALLMAVQSPMHPALWFLFFFFFIPDICYLCTCYPLPRTEWVSTPIAARFDIGAAPRGFKIMKWGLTSGATNIKRTVS